MRKCLACGEPLADELVAIGAPMHVLCGGAEYRRDLSYCLWGRKDGRFTRFPPPEGWVWESSDTGGVS